MQEQIEIWSKAGAFSTKHRGSKHKRKRATAGEIFDVEAKRGSVIAASVNTQQVEGGKFKSTIIDLEAIEQLAEEKRKKRKTMFNKQGVPVNQEDGYSYESSSEEEDSFHSESDPDEPALLKELRRGSAS